MTQNLRESAILAILLSLVVGCTTTTPTSTVHVDSFVSDSIGQGAMTVAQALTILNTENFLVQRGNLHWGRHGFHADEKTVSHTELYFETLWNGTRRSTVREHIYWKDLEIEHCKVKEYAKPGKTPYYVVSAANWNHRKAHGGSIHLVNLKTDSRDLAAHLALAFKTLILNAQPKPVESSIASPRERMRELKAMLDSGLISDSDYEKKKETILNSL